MYWFQFLIESGAQADARIDNGETPLDVATRNHHFDIMEVTHNLSFNTTSFSLLVPETKRSSSFNLLRPKFDFRGWDNVSNL